MLYVRLMRKTHPMTSHPPLQGFHIQLQIPQLFPTVQPPQLFYEIIIIKVLTTEYLQADVLTFGVSQIRPHSRSVPR